MRPGVHQGPLGGLKQASEQICDTTSGLPILGHLSGRAPVDAPHYAHTHPTDRPQSRSKEKQHVADGAGREALTFRQCPFSNLYWQSLTLCSLWPRNAQSPVRYPKQVCGAESHQLMTGTQSLEVLLPSQSNKRNCHWPELWFSAPTAIFQAEFL